MPTNADTETRDFSALMAWAMLGATLLLSWLNAYAGLAVGTALYFVSVRRSRSRWAKFLLAAWIIYGLIVIVGNLGGTHHLIKSG